MTARRPSVQGADRLPPFHARAGVMKTASGADYHRTSHRPDHEKAVGETCESVFIPAAPRRLFVSKLGTVEYGAAWELQRRLADARGRDRIPDVLLLLEHPHTYTLGRRGNMQNVLLSETELAQRGIALYHVDRGGDVTYHGPQQLVAYPILKLPTNRLDYVRYIRDVEHSMLMAVHDLGVDGRLQDRYSGVWVGNDKICAIGVKVDASGVTSHGVALNVNVDLSYFSHIVPCGLSDKGVTSLHQTLGRRVSMDRVMKVVTRRLAETFELRARGTDRLSLDAAIR